MDQYASLRYMCSALACHVLKAVVITETPFEPCVNALSLIQTSLTELFTSGAYYSRILELF